MTCPNCGAGREHRMYASYPISGDKYRVRIRCRSCYTEFSLDIPHELYHDKDFCPLEHVMLHWEEAVTAAEEKSMAYEQAPDESYALAGDDVITKPSHYQIGDTGIEAKHIIQLVLNSELCGHMTTYQAHCFGTYLKYRLRAGEKDNLEQDINKSNQYLKMYGEDSDGA